MEKIEAVHRLDYKFKLGHTTHIERATISWEEYRALRSDVKVAAPLPEIKYQDNVSYAFKAIGEDEELKKAWQNAMASFIVEELITTHPSGSCNELALKAAENFLDFVISTATSRLAGMNIKNTDCKI